MQKFINKKMKEMNEQSKAKSNESDLNGVMVNENDSADLSVQNRHNEAIFRNMTFD